MLTRDEVLQILHSSGFENIQADDLPKFQAITGKAYRAGVAAERARLIELFSHEHKRGSLNVDVIVDKINNDEGYKKIYP